MPTVSLKFLETFCDYQARSEDIAKSVRLSGDTGAIIDSSMAIRGL